MWILGILTALVWLLLFVVALRVLVGGPWRY